MKKHNDYTAQELFQLLNETSECNWIEAKGKSDTRNPKSGRDDYRTLLETVCSFSNEPGLGGGVILLGVGENREGLFKQFEVEDLDDLDKAQTDIATQCKSSFNTPVYPEISLEKIQGKTVLKIWVPELPESRKPLYFTNKGLPSGAFRRVGSADLRCTDDDLGIFYQDAFSSFDQTVVPGAYIKDVDPAALERYRTLRAKVNPNAEELTYNDQDLLEALGCVSYDNPEQLNLAGVLIFGSSKLQRRVIPTMRVDYIRVPGNEWVQNPEESFASIDMRGPLMLLVYRVIDAINADLPKGFLLKKGDVQAKSKGLPSSVLREAVVNAVMHRSYRIDRPTQVILDDNRLEIINAGYSLKDEERYNRPGSEIRNKIIAPIFHETNLAETKGTGVERMRKAMREANLAAPTFESDRGANQFTARFLLHHFLGTEDLIWLERFNEFDLDEQQKVALIFLRETGAVDNLTYRQMNNCDVMKASRGLRAMRDIGILQDKGKGSATHYVPGEKFLELNAPESMQDNSSTSIQDNGESMQDNSSTSIQGNGESMQDSGSTSIQDNEQIKKVLSGLKKRMSYEDLAQLICSLCAIKPMSKKQLSSLLNRDETYLLTILKRMMGSKLLRYSEDMQKHPDQAYITNTKENIR